MQNLAPKIKAIQQRYAGNQVFIYFGISNQILQNFLVKANYSTLLCPWQPWASLTILWHCKTVILTQDVSYYVGKNTTWDCTALQTSRSESSSRWTDSKMSAVIFALKIVSTATHVFTGCLPTLATIPVWIGLYRALSNVANEV
jgi:hypothetical protein